MFSIPISAAHLLKSLVYFLYFFFNADNWRNVFNIRELFHSNTNTFLVHSYEKSSYEKRV